jgi:hypothetical protein
VVTKSTANYFGNKNKVYVKNKINELEANRKKKNT